MWLYFGGTWCHSIKNQQELLNVPLKTTSGREKATVRLSKTSLKPLSVIQAPSRCKPSLLFVRHSNLRQMNLEYSKYDTRTFDIKEKNLSDSKNTRSWMSTERRILGMFPHRLMHHDETLYVLSRSFTKNACKFFF